MGACRTLRKAFSIAVLTGAALLAQTPRVGRSASEDQIKAIVFGWRAAQKLAHCRTTALSPRP